VKTNLCLTPEDTDYIKRAASSQTRKEIAFAWNLTLKAIEWQATQVARKIGLANANDYAGITRYAIKHKLISV
jgi:hypothetical protein